MGLLKFGFIIAKKNLKQFGTYIFAIIISVALMYVNFNILFDEQILPITDDTRFTVPLIGALIMIASIIFISVANNYFLVERSKEMAVVAMSGKSEYDISTILFYQNMIIFLGGSLLGLLFGFCVSPLFMKFVHGQIGFVGSIFRYSSLGFWYTFATLILLFVTLLMCNLGYFIRKEVREIINEEREENVPKKRKFSKVLIIGYIFMYLFPFLFLMIDVPIKDLAQYASIFGTIGVVGCYGILSTVIPALLNWIKSKKKYKNRTILMSVSNLRYSLKSNLTLTIGSAIISILLASFTTLNSESKPVILCCILAFLIIIPMFIVSLIYKVAVDAVKRRKTFKQMNLLGFTKKEITKVIYDEVRGLFLINCFVPFIQLFYILLTSMLCGMISNNIGTLILVFYLICNIVGYLISKIVYKKLILG